MKYSRNMRQAATYWARDGNDGFGGVGYAAPVAVLCRWQDSQVLARDTDGNEFTSSAVVYTTTELEPEGRIALGTFADAEPVTSSREIRQTGKSPNLRQNITLNKLWLG